MKNELIFSYKRVKSRPKFVDFDRLNWLRTLFSIKFSQLMSQSTLLINIDGHLLEGTLRLTIHGD